MTSTTGDRIQAPRPIHPRPEPRSGLLYPPRFMALLGLVVFLVALVLPFVNASQYMMSIGTQALIYIMLAMGLNIVVGYAGLLDLGYYAFFAVGAYTAGVFNTALHVPLIWTVPMVIIACIAAGLIIGGPTLRLRSDYLAIVTLGFGEIIRLTANNLEVTGGPSGISGISTFEFFGWSFRDGLEIAGIEFPGYVLLYYFCLVVGGVLAVVAASRLGRGKLGRAWRAIKDDEDAAEAMGINTYTTKLKAYVLGAVFGGLAGILMGAHQTAVSPTSFVFLNSALLLMAVVLGGMGSIPGVIIGALVISLLPELLREVAEWRFLVFGVLLVVMMIFRPAGVWPSTAVLPFLKFRAPGQKPSPRDGFGDHDEDPATAPADENIDKSKEQA
ncbi:branched-chain amino acid ABC transporter permease [Pseudoclavibacter chungangensis]|uniref:Branched-chain amino acid ABC transporter permease n=1 Tax=Pseudoclavibacter chungangensis TaxID=587635 RepID=A0A7J5C305_9MICO|nr:branched-chain amino acid ABC transporter permease [Pseudoclavibacter chungangensis]KAB1662217.1 branched-chain amino acid ABC transporter permease [Pseudoclavibacter chungangensis]NYJ65415.1 branched-chain amino acid transport system permease protein [Pseudoclavibacter chungangensis]